MSDYQAEIWFAGICTVLGVLQFIGRLQERMGEEREMATRNRSRIDHIIHSADLEAIRMELALLVSETIREPLKRITMTVDFREDLRVPPGEMEILFDEVDESFQIELERAGIHTFRDLLQQICEQRSS